MKISKQEATALFTSLGFKSAGKWTTKKFQKMVDKLPENDIDDETEVSDEAKPVLSKVIKAFEKGDSVKVTEKGEPSGDDEETPKSKTKSKSKTKGKTASTSKKKSSKNEETSKSKSKTKGKSAAPAKKTAKKKGKAPAQSQRSSSAERNKFGSVVGSSLDIMDKTLTKKAKTASEIKQESGLTPGQFRYAHLADLVAQGFAEEVMAGPNGKTRAWKLKK